MALLEQEKPGHLLVAFDSASPTFRHELLPSYKSSRPKSPPNFGADLENLRLLLKFLRVPTIVHPGLEADDLLAAAAHQASQAGYTVRLVSGDTDLWQLVDDSNQVAVLRPRSTAISKAKSRSQAATGAATSTSGVYDFIDEAAVQDAWGVTPSQVPDFKALKGDASDDIPGVAGIGPKTAASLLSSWGTVEGIFSNLDSLKPSEAKKLRGLQDEVALYKDLVSVRKEHAVGIDVVDSSCLQGFCKAEVEPLLRSLELTSVIKTLQRMQELLGGALDPLPALTCQVDAAVQQLKQAACFESSAAAAETGDVGSREHDSEAISTTSSTGTALLPARLQCRIPVVTVVQSQSELQELMNQLQLHQSRLAVMVPNEHLTFAQVLSAVQPLLSDAARPKAMYESKRCSTELRHLGVQLSGVAYDVVVAAYLLDPERWEKHINVEKLQATALPVMVLELLDASLADMAAVLQAAAAPEPGRLSFNTDTSTGVLPEVWYAAAEAWSTYLLKVELEHQYENLNDGGLLTQLLQAVEVPLQEVLSDMEVFGIRCEQGRLEQQKQELQAEEQQLMNELHTIAGEQFNLRSRETLSNIMFNKLQLDPQDLVPRTRTGGFKSTSLAAIRMLPEHPFVSIYLQWAARDSLLSKYYNDSYLGAINPSTGRIHGIIGQCCTATGRLISVKPNMQNVPQHEARAREFRKAFKPSPGCLLVAADYSQMELRVLAQLSGDVALRQDFAAGRDVHEATARQLLEKQPEDAVTPAERQLGKKINFGVVYGLGARKLAEELDMTQAQAKMFLDRFLALHPEMAAFMTHSTRGAVAKGYTQSELGRRRLFRFQGGRLRQFFGQDLQQVPDLSGLKKLANRDDAHVLRQAGNAPVQGTSADILKVAMVELHRRLTPSPYNCRLLLTVHDEVLLEVPQQHWPTLEADIKSIMDGVLCGKFGLQVKVVAGEDWYQCG
eukprot:gene3591-3856_t